VCYTIRMRLLDRARLHASSVVANCNMNRERTLRGYARELGLAPVSFLRAFPAKGRWMDLCCGSGRALVEAASGLEDGDEPILIEGIDLVAFFAENPFTHRLALREESVEAWRPRHRYQLVTCVHGLHYVGDKLGVLAKAAAALAEDGLLLANLDLGNLCFADGRPAGRTVAARLRRGGLRYDRRRRLVSCFGPRKLELGLRYLGADDSVGPNYTGQPAVTSCYADLD
jgi:SAM-dependent methyltransferase